ncbi:MAG: hypothetical protein K2H09_04950 [Treponemataceae bacterium]|nr:hypothetical protein [Treponemataceae bacterium]
MTLSLHNIFFDFQLCGARIPRRILAARPVISGALSVALVSAVLAYKAQAEAAAGGGAEVQDVPAVSLSASKAAFIPGATERPEDANRHGVFPVRLEWSIAGLPAVREVRIERRLYGSGAFETVAVVPAEPPEFIDRNEDALPGETYCYRISAALPARGELAAESSGYGALTYLAYIDEYNESVMLSHSKMTLMHKHPNLAKLGKEQAEGAISGTLSYRTKVRGFHGIVLMDYAGYSDVPGWILDGSTNTKANLAANGMMFSCVRCAGMYPGAVYYDDIQIKKGAARGGFYTVEPEGFPCGTVAWDAVRAEREELLPRPQEDEAFGDVEYDEAAAGGGI